MSLTVVIPTYNCARYLAQAIDSILTQTRAPDEVIVVDDGSTDETPALLSTYRGRVRVIRQDNQGVSAARNAGLTAAHTRYVAMMDADDVSHEERLEKQFAALSAADVVACFTGQRVFNERGVIAEYRGSASDANADPLVHVARCVVLPATVMLDRDKAWNVRYPLNVTLGEDIIYVAMLRARGTFVVVPDVLYSYRRRPGQATEASITDGFLQRLAWAEAEWPGSSEKLWREYAACLGTYYWARNKARFFEVRAFLRENWPRQYSQPGELSMRWYPDWLWNLKERLTQHS